MPRSSSAVRTSQSSILRYLTGPQRSNSNQTNNNVAGANGQSALSEEFVNENSEASTLGSDYEEAEEPLNNNNPVNNEIINNESIEEEDEEEEEDQFLPNVNMRIPVPISPDKSNVKKSVLSQLAEQPDDSEDKENAKEEDDEDDSAGCECPICLEQWTNSGPHRLVALKCGHLFGLKCIKRWIKDKTPDAKSRNNNSSTVAKCPQCNAVAKKHDIRLIYAKKLSAVDTAELDRLQKSLAEERGARGKADSKLAAIELQLSCTFRELQRCQDELKHWKALYEQKSSQLHSSRGNDVLNVDNDSMQVEVDEQGKSDLKSGKFKLRYSARISAAPEEQCRKLAVCPQQNMLITSLSAAPSATNNSGHPHGLVKISVRDLKWQERIPNIHSNQIRDLCKHPDDIGMILSTGWDQKMKITDVLRTNSILYSFNMESKGWSCCWSHCKNVALSGLANSSIIGHDIRMPNSPLIKVSSDLFGGVKMKPLHTMEYVTIDDGNHGLLIAHYDGVYYIPYNTDSKSYGTEGSVCIYKVPQVGLFQCTFAKFIESVPDNLIVVGVRSKLQIQHLIIKFPRLDVSHEQPGDPIAIVHGGTAKVISKSTTYRHTQTKPVIEDTDSPKSQETEKRMLFTFNEQKKKVMLYDIRNSTEQVYQEMNIPGHSPVIEFEQWQKNGVLEQDGVFALDESMIAFYEYVDNRSC